MLSIQKINQHNTSASGKWHKLDAAALQPISSDLLNSRMGKVYACIRPEWTYR
jgi:hypothetical protein